MIWHHYPLSPSEILSPPGVQVTTLPQFLFISWACLSQHSLYSFSSFSTPGKTGSQWVPTQWVVTLTVRASNTMHLLFSDCGLTSSLHIPTFNSINAISIQISSIHHPRNMSITKLLITAASLQGSSHGFWPVIPHQHVVPLFSLLLRLEVEGSFLTPLIR